MMMIFDSILSHMLSFLSIISSNYNGENSVKGLISTATCTNCLLLNSGWPIPIVGLGTSRLGKTDEEVIRAIKDAIDVGYRHIDTADFYLNEHAIGEALEDVIKSGKVKREELFITTKVWSNHHTKELALTSVRRSLKRLKLDYLDLVLVHWPMSFPSGGDYLPRTANNTLIEADLNKENFELAYQGLEEAVKLGLVRSIGVSNFNIAQLEKILMIGKIIPAVNQVESHPFLTIDKLLQYCTKKNIRIEAYSPIRRGDAALLENPTLKTIATRHGRTVAQVTLRWQIQLGVIVIPKTSRRKRMIENKQLFGFTLTPQEMISIGALDIGDRVIKYEDGRHLAEYPFAET